MTTEELLKPRYKVIADWPDSKNKVGDIIEIQTAQTEAAKDLVCGWYNKYPHLFEPLPWWKERKAGDMPRYIKGKERIYEVTEWRKDMLGWFYPMNKVDGSTKDDTVNFANIEWHFIKDQFLPVSEANYLAYLQTTNQNNG
jgi:hypothetical protein